MFPNRSNCLKMVSTRAKLKTSALKCAGERWLWRELSLKETGTHQVGFIFLMQPSFFVTQVNTVTTSARGTFQKKKKKRGDCDRLQDALHGAIIFPAYMISCFTIWQTYLIICFL
ncbi:hypothetical protein DM01DRAFT_203723 [Hesseltinella vesiculosa]|uniref:Uncharacterized protein n=1 Tax=Hesseltinella vesiculosa TaxID=101127 RepID=A0A1X2GER9_9FUNG|nr:hypothetical protein DM01DRAFT_203723 [Hesseltinella vesiculosa]